MITSNDLVNALSKMNKVLGNSSPVLFLNEDLIERMRLDIEKAFDEVNVLFEKKSKPYYEIKYSLQRQSELWEENLEKLKEACRLIDEVTKSEFSDELEVMSNERLGEAVYNLRIALSELLKRDNSLHVEKVNINYANQGYAGSIQSHLKNRSFTIYDRYFERPKSQREALMKGYFTKIIFDLCNELSRTDFECAFDVTIFEAPKLDFDDFPEIAKKAWDHSRNSGL